MNKSEFITFLESNSILETSTKEIFPITDLIETPYNKSDNFIMIILISRLNLF